MRAIVGLLTVALVGITGCVGAQDEVSPEKTKSVHSSDEAQKDAWGRVLEVAQESGGLSYGALKEHPEDLRAVVSSLGDADPGSLGREQALAFWINAYNALVAQAVVDRYPGLESVMDVEGFFDQQRHSIAGEELTLNEIEGRALKLGEPRVHFAVVCASTGCPDLRDEPFVAEDLERQLQEQTAAFLADESKGLRYDAATGELWLSSIFDWYAKDFGGDAVKWILPRLPEDLSEKWGEQLQATAPTVRFLDYDWSLNDRSP